MIPETQFYLSIQGRNIPLTYNTQLTQADIPKLQSQGYDGVVAQINPNPKNPAILGLKNCSAQIWTATLPTGEIRQIQTGQSVKLEENTQINFGLVIASVQKFSQRQLKIQKISFLPKKLTVVGGFIILMTGLVISQQFPQLQIPLLSELFSFNRLYVFSHQLNGDFCWVRGLAISPNQKNLVSVCDYDIKIWNLSTGELERTIIALLSLWGR